MTKYWVSMTDRFLSGWGSAEGKTNKLVIECDNYEEAEIVADNARRRSEMKYINICLNKPRYGKGVLVSYHGKGDYGRWFEKGAF
jgi:hypothetical protein